MEFNLSDSVQGDYSKVENIFVEFYQFLIKAEHCMKQKPLKTIFTYYLCFKDFSVNLLRGSRS